MNCTLHPLTESQGNCSACGKPLCSVCIYKVKGKPFCQDCIVQGAEWAPLIKGGRLSSSAPKWAAFWALIPGIGAVYNGEYLKAVAHFSIFAWLVVMADSVDGIFGFAAAVFLLFTLFDGYRTAQEKSRKRLELGIHSEIGEAEDTNTILWGWVLIVLGVLFLAVKIVPERYVNLFWPIVFVFLGIFIVYRALQAKQGKITHKPEAPLAMNPDPGSHKEDV
jgi:hypothetical protein